MADESTSTTTEEGTSGGAGGAGGGRPKKKGLLHGKHRTEILVIGGAAVVALLVLLLRGRGGGASSSSAAAPLSQTAATTGRVQAGSIGQVAGSDIAALGGLQTLLANQADALTRLSANVDDIIGGKETPKNPMIASTLFAPQYTGQYVRAADGLIGEVQSDGSVFGVTLPQWLNILKVTNNQAAEQVTQFDGGIPGTVYSTTYNIGQKVKAGSGATTAS